MRLKRGVERASCDFCHSRKIKCDRASRETQGHASCSPCSLRQIQCSLDDSGDVRLRRRRRTNIHDENGTEQDASQLVTRISANVNIEDFNISGVNVDPIPQEVLERPMSIYFPSVIDNSIPSSVDQTPDFTSVDTPFELSSESILFLDQIFMGGYEVPQDYVLPLTIMDGNIHTSLDSEQATNNSQDEPALADSAPSQPWIACDIDEATFNAALHAYFDFAAIYLPVIIEDAFWQDYRAGRCSLALVYAIACRGIPLTATQDSWDKQQRLAFKFREEFLEAQQVATGKSAMRLDNLEALAIMVNWTYDETQSSTLLSKLGSLFLTHESLVLTTLQSQMQDCSIARPGASGFLARSEERRTLLFWHVYGLDAFHSLDQKVISRIPDGENNDNNDTQRKLPQHDSGSYLDAVLNLGIIARVILQALVTTSAKRKGITLHAVTSIYERLNRWQKHDCPPHLRRRRDGEGRLLSLAINESSKATFVQPLHCSILWLLEINCYMQVEDCVSQYGVQNVAPFEAEMTALRVDFEALRAVQDGLEIAQWMKQYSATTSRGAASQSYSLFDLAPSIARDICAGLCFWICERGKNVLRHGSPSVTHVHPKNRHREAKAGKDKTKQDACEYMKAAKEFRSAVATATSHRDTKYVLERLDKQIVSFEEALAH
ncbi:fungal transcriptional regulatory [Trichoderma arundinaceum]|uniref:Fungal transcriptional regulatory n=1 Tax=Trichoderma arundinaceum TaxID=490622 RepID=A0A395NWG1_TRIAR|nr:fungal transcriptional regulatory [Trichoderma arundinaceum]